MHSQSVPGSLSIFLANISRQRAEGLSTSRAGGDCLLPSKVISCHVLLAFFNIDINAQISVSLEDTHCYKRTYSRSLAHEITKFCGNIRIIIYM